MRFDSTLRLICVGLLFASCADEGEDNDSGTNTDPSVGDDDVGTGDDSGSASMTGQTMSGSMTAGDTGDDSGTGGPASDSGTDDGPTEPQPNGSTCTENEQCISGYCFVVQLLGGVCGECLVDADCPDGGGCSLPNPIVMPPVGAVCNDGGPGEGCMTDEVCMDGLVCASIISVPGILEANTCSECTMDAECMDGMLCSPIYDVLNVSGQKVCVEPGTVENGQGCDAAGMGDMACMSGICAAINIMDVLMVGVCGECEVDADCDVAGGEMCLPADVDTDTGVVTPPLCGVPK